MDRRSMLKGVALAAAISASTPALGEMAPSGQQGRMALPIGPTLQSGERPFRIAMIIYDAMTNQDFVGPHDIFACVRVAEIDLLAKTSDPITTDSGVRMLCARHGALRVSATGLAVVVSSVTGR